MGNTEGLLRQTEPPRMPAVNMILSFNKQVNPLGLGSGRIGSTMTNEPFGNCNTTNQTLLAWVEEKTKLCEPDHVFWCDGSEKEKEFLTADAVARGVLIKLNQEKLPGCYYHRSNPNDVPRVEQATYICTETQQEAGPTNNWAEPKEMYQKLQGLCRGARRGRTLYVVPYLMRPPGSPLTKVGIELTDSIYVG